MHISRGSQADHYKAALPLLSMVLAQFERTKSHDTVLLMERQGDGYTDSSTKLAVSKGSLHIPESGHLLFTPSNSTVNMLRLD